MGAQAKRDNQAAPASYWDDRAAPRPDVGASPGLPALLYREVEIARIRIGDSHSYEISIRAQPIGGRIGYRIVDRYQTAFWYGPPSSDGPLPMAELVQLIDFAEHDSGTGLITAFLEEQRVAGTPPSKLRHFVAVSSAFYPALSRHYEIQVNDWVDRCIREDSGWGELEDRLRAEVGGFQRRVALRQVAPLSPIDVAAGRRLDELDDRERAAIARWLRLRRGYLGAEISWSPAGVEATGKTARRRPGRFSVVYGAGEGDRVEIRRDPRTATEFPPVISFFASLAVGQKVSRDVDRHWNDGSSQP